MKKARHISAGIVCCYLMGEKKKVGGTTFTFACTCKTKLWKDSQTAVANFRRRSNWADGRKAFHNVPV